MGESSEKFYQQLTDDPDVKDCPFCGSTNLAMFKVDRYPASDIDLDKWAYFVSCECCRAQGGWSKSPSGAQRMWDMRSSLRLKIRK